MKRAVRLEIRKMRRLRTLPMTLVLVLTVAALSSASLFSNNARETFDDPSAQPWAATLLTYTLVAAMTSPILTAVLASRQTDIEHSATGWALASTAGYTPATLCRAKLIALSLVVVPAVIMQSFLVIMAGVLAGIRVPLDLGAWTGYTAMLALVNIVFLAFHIWLAARMENQLISVGVGMLGAFVAVFALLMPATTSRVIPWGYYAVISHTAQMEGDVVYVTPEYAWIAGFLAISGCIFVIVTRLLDRVER